MNIHLNLAGFFLWVDPLFLMFDYEYPLFLMIVPSDIFNDFHNHSSFVRSLNSTFLVMISKKAHLKNLNDFRPISFIACMYKLLSKVLAKKLSKTLNHIIEECQHAFVFGRQTTGVILIANEIVDDVIRYNKKGILCKFDMEKAFDHVNSDF